MRLLCITHVAFEGPAKIAEWARSRGHELAVVRADLPGMPLSLDAHGTLIVMGGPMSANDNLPWLARELRLIESALEQRRPVVGVCLGAQLLAKVLGARVFPAPSKEIGWWPVQAVPHELPGRNLRLPDKFVPFHWHGETFELPLGAQRLAGSAAVENQGFLFEDRALGLQFHLEATSESVRAIINEGSEDITEGPWVQSASAMLANCDAHCRALEPSCYSLLDDFFEGAASPSAGSGRR